MLTEQEAEKVDHLIALLELPSHRDKLVGDQVLWLAQRVKELNEELKSLNEELKFSGILEERLTNQLRIQQAEISNIKIKLNKKCNCVGLVHVNTCPQWELPV